MTKLRDSGHYVGAWTVLFLAVNDNVNQHIHKKILHLLSTFDNGNKSKFKEQWTCRWRAAGAAHHLAPFLEQTRSRCHSGSCSRSEDHSRGRGRPGTSPPPGPGSRRALSFCRTDAPEHNQAPGESPRSNQSAGWWFLLWMSGIKGNQRGNDHGKILWAWIFRARTKQRTSPNSPTFKTDNDFLSTLYIDA